VRVENPIHSSSKKERIEVLLADDQAAFRASLQTVLESTGDIEVVGQARNGLEAVRLTRVLRPQVVVMDMAMPLLNGLQATRRLKLAFPSIQVLLLSAHSDPAYIRQAMAFGASGYLIKQSSIEVLGEAIRGAVRGNSAFSSSLPKDLRDEMRFLFLKLESIKKKAAARSAAT
jgi:DNA-binding NarL/FixJ family response regulator